MPSFASAASGATSKIPELNPFCWKEKDCADIRVNLDASLDSADAAKGCIKEAPCDQKGWCKCLAGAKTDTKIAIGGKTEFLHLGQYVMTVFNYAMIVAGILAVLVIVVSGIEWLTSGGNSDTIGRAQKRIVGAFVGLFIAYGSFFILSTINPALVNLRLPQAWLIKTQRLIPQFCSALPNTTKFAEVGKYNDQVAKPTVPKSADYKYSYDKYATAFWCGSRFQAEDGGDATCMGSYCAPEISGGKTYPRLCTETGKPKTAYQCSKGLIGGSIYYREPLTKVFGNCTPGVEGWDQTPVDKVQVTFLCEKALASGKAYMVDVGVAVGVTPKGKKWVYNIPVALEDVKEKSTFCSKGKSSSDLGGVKGVLLKVGLDEGCKLSESHYVGKNGLDLGDFGFLTDNGYKINKNHLFTIDDLKKGIILDVDANKITDIDSTFGDEVKKEWNEAGYYNNLIK